MTSEEYGSLLRIEYGFWQQAIRSYNLGRITREQAVTRMDLQRNHIIGWKQRCREELDPDTYPEEYYREEPEPADQALPQEEKMQMPDPDNDGTQMNIYDFLREDGEIRWR